MARVRYRTIRLQVFVHASLTKVFKAITEPKLLSRWLLDSATLSPHKGARYSFTWDGGPTHTGEVLEFVRRRRISLTWQWPGSEKLVATKLRLSAEPKGRGTVVKFTHSGFPKDERWIDPTPERSGGGCTS
jgi:uncharacterized protein YndB with AHSA1/START domain